MPLNRGRTYKVPPKSIYGEEPGIYYNEKENFWVVRVKHKIKKHLTITLCKCKTEKETKLKLQL